MKHATIVAGMLVGLFLGCRGEAKGGGPLPRCRNWVVKARGVNNRTYDWCSPYEGMLACGWANASATTYYQGTVYAYRRQCQKGVK